MECAQAFSITSFVGSAASAWFETVQSSTERAVENFMEITESVDQFVTSHLDEQTGGFLGPQQDPATRPYRTERLHKERHGGARPAVRSDDGAEHAVAPAGAWDDFSIDGSEVRHRRICCRCVRALGAQNSRGTSARALVRAEGVCACRTTTARS